MRRPLIAGNWKMYKTAGEAARLVEELLPLLGDVAPEVVLCPPFTALAAVAERLRGTTIALGAQNMHWAEEGAFTGEISAPMLKEAGCSFVILGHSERRQFFAETDAAINKKVKAALGHGLRPILCVGETLEERRSGQTARVVSEQLGAALEGLRPEEAAGLVVAYEPVWAIGTGLNASGEEAVEVISGLRRRLASLQGEEVSLGMRMLYGGSVKPDNISAFMDLPEIDGALVGGASLNAGTFADIVRYKMRGRVC